MYTIGKLAELSGVTVRTLRYYDEIGLLTPSAKSEGGHRLYEEQALAQLHMIQYLKR
ncbi:MerR family transcriptional regulator [Alkalihalobacillus sp. LMS39]|uniref:MerR family transcriptional regulator n=1 Tax=Alkalihalobacillus sp. LMS39 TaxID=2924032 RepID=UPI001FB20A90|nr:MerR family transcriptional regulator [Alkalihalobacillus sp. LMS39]UOE95043.1 MerR family transcriptional regulator [Alkalihalobacillus sp. LMS39]